MFIDPNGLCASEIGREGYAQVLVGSPFTDSDGRRHRHGHMALALSFGEQGRVYDFGRYGETWGIRQSEGEGILRVWKDVEEYLNYQNSLGRTTTSYGFKTEPIQHEVMQDYFPI